MKGTPRHPQQAAAPQRASWLVGSASAQDLPDERPPRRRRRTTLTLYDQLLNSIGLVLVLGLCAAMWYTGAVFTIGWLAERGVTTASVGPLVWGLPICLTLGELALMPFFRHQDALRTLIWLGIVGFDVLTTVSGAEPWLRSQAGALLTTPQGDGTLLAALVLGLLLALGPEPIARHVWQTR